MNFFMMIEELDAEENTVRGNVHQYTREELSEMYSNEEILEMCAGLSVVKVGKYGTTRHTDLVCYYNMNRA